MKVSTGAAAQSCRLCGGKRLKQILDAQTFRILRCAGCEVAFTHPPPLPLDYELRDFHSGENPRNSDTLVHLHDLHPDWQNLIKMQVTLTREAIDTECSVLEIGCGEGIFLEELRKLEFKDLTGIEPSRNAVVRARSKGLEIENSYFNSSQIDRRFDLIMLSHVLEHFEDPIDALQRLRSRLNDGGFLLFTQTNYLGLLPRIYGVGWYAWVPDQHYWHFTPRSLGRLLRGAGFKTLKVNYCPLVHAKSRLTRIANLLGPARDQFLLLACHQEEGRSNLQGASAQIN